MIAGYHLAGDSDDAIAVMVVQEPRESLRPHQEARMLPVVMLVLLMDQSQNPE